MELVSGQGQGKGDFEKELIDELGYVSTRRRRRALSGRVPRPDALL